MNYLLNSSALYCLVYAGWLYNRQRRCKGDQFYKDEKSNYENADDVDLAILKAGLSSETIEA